MNAAGMSALPAWVALSLGLSTTVALWAEPDVRTIIKKSVAANEVDFEAAPHYGYRERVRTGQTTKTYDVMMIDGSPYNRLIAINGKPLSQEASVKEQQKLEQVKSQRASESNGDREQRIAKYEKDRRRDHLMMEQLTDAFDFALVGERRLNSFDVYVLRATPRPGYKPPNMETEVLPGMRGQLWIDKNSFQWVKVTAQVIHPVTVEGFLAQVEPGTRFELEKMPVNGAVWLPKHFAMKSQAKVLFLFNNASQEDDTYFDYRKMH